MTRCVVRLDVSRFVRATFHPVIEVSLDCPACERCRRTVVFRNGGVPRCTPTGHDFPGLLDGLDVQLDGTRCAATYTLIHDYRDFVDAKYPERRPTGRATWARIHVRLDCLVCTAANEITLEPDLGHSSTARCRCGLQLITDMDTIPLADPAPAARVVVA